MNHSDGEQWEVFQARESKRLRRRKSCQFQNLLESREQPGSAVGWLGRGMSLKNTEHRGLSGKTSRIEGNLGQNDSRGKVCSLLAGEVQKGGFPQVGLPSILNGAGAAQKLDLQLDLILIINILNIKPEAQFHCWESFKCVQNNLGKVNPLSQLSAS